MRLTSIDPPGVATRCGLAALSLLLSAATAVAQSDRPAAQAPGDQPTFRAGVRLATYDAVVTDDKGRPVTDLTVADFEVVERGRRQAVRQAAYVHAAGPAAAAGAATAQHASPPAPIAGAAKDAPEVAPVAFRGSLHLGDALPAGAYVLQLTVAEDGSKAVPAIQWVDFEVH